MSRRFVYVAVIVLSIFMFMGFAVWGQDDNGITITDAWVRATANEISDDSHAGMAMDMGAPKTILEVLKTLTVTAPMDMPTLSLPPAAAYMTITNNGDDAASLISVSTDVAEFVEIHATTIENDIARMSPVDELDIPAGNSVALEPGGYHIMLINLTRDLIPGETIALKLTFASNIEMTIDVPVMDEFMTDMDQDGNN
jgi:copper(I)-binding protein